MSLELLVILGYSSGRSDRLGRLMKTFTAKQLSNNPGRVFREVDLRGVVKINHGRYPDKIFILEGRARHQYVDGEAVDPGAPEQSEEVTKLLEDANKAFCAELDKRKFLE